MLPVLPPRNPEEAALTEKQVSHYKDKQLELLLLTSDHNL